MLTRSPRLLARMLLAAAPAFVLLVGCELAVDPDVGLAEVPVQPCLACLDASETVITEPDGNVLIVPISSLDDGGSDGAEGGGDDDSASDASLTD